MKESSLFVFSQPFLSFAMDQVFISKELLFAVDFAAQKHTTQRRKNAAKTPYIEHPIGVALTLSECGVKDLDVLIGALLHDTIEDTETTWEELNQHFTPKAVSFVREVTDDKTLSKAERKRLQVEHAKTATHGARLIKMSDKLYNLRSLLGGSPPVWWDAKRIQGYFVWSKAVIDAACQSPSQPVGQLTPILKLRQLLDEVFSGQFLFKGDMYDCIPKGVDTGVFLESYYRDMVEAGKVEDD